MLATRLCQIGPDDPAEIDDRTPMEFDDEPWDAFLPDEGSYEPHPEPGDFWIEK